MVSENSAERNACSPGVAALNAFATFACTLRRCRLDFEQGVSCRSAACPMVATRPMLLLTVVGDLHVLAWSETLCTTHDETIACIQRAMHFDLVSGRLRGR